MVVLPFAAGPRRLLAVSASFAMSWTGLASAASEPSAGDYFVHSLPGAPAAPQVKMHAGHIEVTPEHNGNLFFWHFQNKHIANRQRTVIWLNGGPGCSSEDGALMEIGPYRLKDDHTLEYNDGSWNEFANVMFVDNPVGTGYSYVDTDSYVHELDEMADQFIIFLEKWFALFPEYEHDDLYLAGESYAGQHIPYIAKHILGRNRDKDASEKWNLKGLLIGNGWIAPTEQYEAYLQFSYEKGLIQKDSDTAKELEVKHRICQKELSVGPDQVSKPSCENILQDILQDTSTVKSDGVRQCYNMYDVRLRDSYPSCGMNWPPDLAHVTPYLRRADVVRALHINPDKATGWTECSGAVGSSFRATNSLPSIRLLPGILGEIPVMLFSGAEDLICNHLGTESLISNMEWNGGKGFEVSPGTWAPRRDWTVEGEPAGFWQAARNLTYVLFYNSSHMVPFDQPRRTRDMLDRFMGVDISSIGGAPMDSRLDGEKGPETTVSGASGNGTTAQEAEKAKLDEAKWEAYRKSGGTVLVIVIIAVIAWGYLVWRGRRHRAGYQGLDGGEDGSGGRIQVGETPRGMALQSFRSGRVRRDVEAGDFDESQLEDLRTHTPTEESSNDHYSVGIISDEEEEEEEREAEAEAAKKMQPNQEL